MKFTALFGQCIRNIWANKVRSFLTTLGVVIGIAAVMYLVGVGNGLQSNVTSRISTLGVTRITVTSQPPGPQTVQLKKGMKAGASAASSPEVASLTTTDYQTIQKVSSVVRTSPEATTSVNIATTSNASTATSYRLYGIDSDYFGMDGFQTQYGSNLTDQQVSSNSPVLVLGQQVAKDLFPSMTNPVGQKLYIQNITFTVVGVLKEPTTTSPLLGGDPTNNVYTDYGQWLSITGNSKFGAIILDTASQNQVNSVASTIKSSLTKTHNITNTNDSDFNVTTNQQLLSTVTSVTSSFSTALTGIAAISLLVGGIGIMNIMLVTVTERTREIGLRRAVGAKTRHILLQFMLESVLLTTIGGGFGILLGFGLSHFISRAFTTKNGAAVNVIIEPKTIVLAVVVSIVTGVVFGLFPAIKASRLDPVEALRYE